jgi:broad specificity phosphatase PhoE
MSMRLLVLVRHGESEGNSGQRLIGSGDPALSAEGREHMREARTALARQVIDLVVASPMRRSWQSAQALLGADVPLRLEPAFREIDFGRWEGKRLAEAEAADPIAYRQWREGDPGFGARVEGALERLLAEPATSALLVVHKGVIRTIVEKLTGEPLADRDRPALGEVILLGRGPDGRWRHGGRSSNPPGVETPHPVAPAA